MRFLTSKYRNYFDIGHYKDSGTFWILETISIFTIISILATIWIIATIWIFVFSECKNLENLNIYIGYFIYFQPKTGVFLLITNTVALICSTVAALLIQTLIQPVRPVLLPAQLFRVIIKV